MPTPVWFDETPVLGALDDDQIVEQLRILGEPLLADKLELALLTHSTGPAHTFSVKGRQMLAREPWSHTVHVAGFVEPVTSMQERLSILSVDGLEADRSLLGERLTVGLDGFQPADYPGGEVHQVLFHFAAIHSSDEVERLHFNVTRYVEEGQPFLYLDQPVFVGLIAGESGLDLRYMTLKVIDTCDRAFLEALEFEMFRRGLRVPDLPWPAVDLASEMAFRMTGKVRGGQPTIQEFCLGLDFTAGRRAPLRTGTYVAAQVPPVEQLVWDWEDWRYHPQSGQIISSRNPEERFPFNYMLITVDRLTLGSRARQTMASEETAEIAQSRAARQSLVSNALVVPSDLSLCEGRGQPLTGAPPDLTIRVRVENGNDGSRLLYTLHSESGRVELNHLDIKGPVLAGSPENFQANLLGKIQALNKGFDSHDEPLIAEEIEQRVTSFGQKLYGDLFPPELRQLYREFRNDVCSIQIISDEPWIPWELIKPYDDQQKPHVDDDFLCLRYELTRWLARGRTPPGEIHVGRLAAVHAGHIPGFKSLTTSDREYEVITGLARRHSGLDDVSLERATHEELWRLLETGGTDLLHVIAHGAFDLETPDDARIILPDKRTFRSSDLTGVLATRIFESRPLVFLNSCLLGQQGYSFTGLGGWAQAFLSAGCGAFLGQQWSVRDSLSFELMQKFYGEMEEGKTFGQAVRAARLHVRSIKPSSPTWSALVPYAHPNGRLVL